MNILITGIVRNCAKTIQREYELLNHAFSGCKNINWFLVESDSTDNSIECLEALSHSNTLFKYESLGILGGQIPDRTERLAHCRNRYLSEILKSDYQHIDYIVIADLDFANKLITKESVEKSLSLTGWDVLTANQKGPYYDIWTLRHALWCNEDCESTYKYLREIGVSHIEALDSAVLSKMITIPPNAPPLLVESAFGGLAIYKKEVLQGRKYIGKSSTGVPCCEHVPLNQSITSDGYKIFIHPALINNGINEHSKRKLWHYQILRTLSAIFKFKR